MGVRLRDEDVYWCTADIGWVTGHSYVVYGPLQNGATMSCRRARLAREGSILGLIEQYGRHDLLYRADAIRAFMKWGVEYPARRDLGSLRLLRSVGEPINPEAWMCAEDIGRNRCPVIDTWWQTETGRIMITRCPV